MKRFIVGLIVIVAIGLALLVPGGIWLNSFIHSDAFRHEVETKASASAGGKVEIKEIDLSILSGVTLAGVVTKVATPQGTVAAQVENIRCSYSLLALFDHKLEIDGVTVVKPQVVLTQQPPAEVATPTAPGEASTTNSKEASSGKTPSLFEVVLKSTKMSDGELSIRDTAGASKADLQGIQVHADTAGYYSGSDITGKLDIAKVLLPQNLKLTDFSTPFTYRTGYINVSPFEASAYSGKLTGSYKLDPTGPSQLEVDGKDIRVEKIGKAADANSSSTLSGSLALQSHWHDVETGKLAGEGDAQITDGKLQGVSALHDIGSLLRINELKDPVLTSVTVHFEVQEGTTHFRDLKIESSAFEMTGSGVIAPDGQLDANMILTLRTSKLPSGTNTIPFHMGGTVSSPHADINPLQILQVPKVQKTLDRAIKHLF